jgi:uncharacterized membrane protein YeaQ/YmgE (transglycosylase-associated protein family)
MSGIIGLIIEIIAGIIGGNAMAAGAKNTSMGATGNSIVGAIGGLVLGQILGALGIGEPGMATAEGAAPPGAGFDVGALISQIIGGGIGGAVLQLIVGLIRNMMRS